MVRTASLVMMAPVLMVAAPVHAADSALDAPGRNGSAGVPPPRPPAAPRRAATPGCGNSWRAARPPAPRRAGADRRDAHLRERVAALVVETDAMQRDLKAITDPDQKKAAREAYQKGDNGLADEARNASSCARSIRPTSCASG